jgi:hypothetical protein
MVKSPCKSGYRRSPKTHRCKPKSTKRRSAKKSSKRRSIKRKSVKKSSKRRSSKTPKTPKSLARHFTVGTRRKGRNEKMWKVAETTAGNLKWVQCGPAHKCTGVRASGPFNAPKSQLGGNPLLLMKAAPYLMKMQAMKGSPKKKKTGFLGLF